MGNAAWGAGHHTGMGEGLALGEEIGRAIGEAAGVKKGVAIGVAASAVVAALGVGLWRLTPWRRTLQHLSGQDQDSSAMNAEPIAEKDVDNKQEVSGGTPSE